MIKLSFREKLKFWRKNKIWLREEINSCINSEDIQIWLGINVNGMICSYFAVEKIYKKVTITQLSKTDDYYFQKDKNQVYIFGTEGVFYKSKGMKLRKILDKIYFTGIGIANGVGIIFIFGSDGKDIVARLVSGEIRKVLDSKKIKCIACHCNPIYFDENEINYLGIFGRCKDNVQVITEENGEYEYYSINKEGMHYGNVCFKQYKQIEDLLNGCLVEAYDKQGKNVVVSLVKNEIKIYFEFDKLIKLDETYYLAEKHLEERLHVLKYEKGKCIKLESIPMIEDNNFTPICIGIEGLKLYKMKIDKGMMLLLIYNNTVKYKFYDGVFDIRLSEPILMKDNNLIEIKAVTCIEKIE